MLQILDSLAGISSTKQKQELLQSFSNLNTVKQIFAMALDKVTYNYGIRQLPEYIKGVEELTLMQALDILKELYKTSGHAGRDLLADTLSKVSVNNAEIVKRIINRDLRVNIGRTMVNKVWPNLVVKVPYMRCNVFSDKTSKYIEFPATLQVKADGRFVYIIKDGNTVTYMSRQGEENDFPQLTEEFLKLQDGVYVGELLVRGVYNRSEANGLLNSSSAHAVDIYVQLWDYLSLEDFANKTSSMPYSIRLSALSTLLEDVSEHSISLVESVEVRSIQEALRIVGNWMSEGKEGGVLKDHSLSFKDHTSNLQLKLKLQMDIEVRCVAFTEGTPGTKREHTFGALVFTNDEGTILGQTSGFTDAELQYIHENMEKYIGKVCTVQFNDISKARDSETYSLMHPRFIEFRDKDTTNTLAEALEIRESAMLLGK